jgi:hypothetical protein
MKFLLDKPRKDVWKLYSEFAIEVKPEGLECQKY